MANYTLYPTFGTQWSKVGYVTAATLWGGDKSPSSPPAKPWAFDGKPCRVRMLIEPIDGSGPYYEIEVPETRLAWDTVGGEYDQPEPVLSPLTTIGKPSPTTLALTLGLIDQTYTITQHDPLVPPSDIADLP